MLNEAEADIENPYDTDGRSPLRQAAIRKSDGQGQVVACGRGQCPLRGSRWTHRPLLCLQVDGEPDVDMVGMLLAKGADPLWANLNGTTPIYHARSRGISEYPVINMMVRATERQSVESNL